MDFRQREGILTHLWAWGSGRRSPGVTTGRPGVKSTLCRAPRAARHTGQPGGGERDEYRNIGLARLGAHQLLVRSDGPPASERNRGGGGARSPASGAIPSRHGTAPAVAPRERRIQVADPSAGQRRPVRQGDRAWRIPRHRQNTSDDQATGLRSQDRAALHFRSAPGGGQRGATGVWRGLDSRLPH